MKYMLLLYGDENAPNNVERESCYVESSHLAHGLNAAGKFIATAPLHATTSATSVRVRGGKQLITDGPFAGAREQRGGFFLIDAADLNEALAIAERIPITKQGPSKYGRSLN